MFSYVVKPGDSIYKLANSFNLSYSLIASVNNIEPPYTIYPGQFLLIPQQDFYYTVEPGDTIFGIAQVFEKRAEDIIKLNNLYYPYTIYIGQRIKIPVPLSYHVVRSGDTLWNIAKKHSINLGRLLKANNLKSYYKIFPGQYIALPGFNPKAQGKIAYIKADLNNKTGLYMLDIESMKFSPLLCGGEEAVMLFISKDRKSISYHSVYYGKRGITIYDLTAGQCRGIVLNDTRVSYWMDWSYNNREIVYSNDRMVVVDAIKGNELRQLKENDIRYPNWLKNNNEIIYLGYGREQTYDILIIDNMWEARSFKKDVGSVYGTRMLDISPDNSKLAHVDGSPDVGFIEYTTIYDMKTGAEIISKADGSFQAWSRSSDKILFIESIYEYKGYFPPEKEPYFKLYVIKNIGGNIERQLCGVATNIRVSTEAWSSDNENSAIVIYNDLYICNGTDSTLTRITMNENVSDALWI